MNISMKTSALLLIIPDGYDYWSIYSESTADIFTKYEKQILSAVDSFDISRSVAESSKISELESEDNVIFEEDSYSFIDLSQRPMSFVTPKEFTPEWYVNSKHDLQSNFQILGEIIGR